jgi:5-methylcytosine-specific restriction endonuclease McrA
VKPKKYSEEDAEWRRVRALWVANNPPNHEGYYVCGVCGKSVHYTEMELDHIDPRSGNPASKYDLANLQPTHGRCNYRKGSRRLKPLISNAEYALRQKLNL